MESKRYRIFEAQWDEVLTSPGRPRRQIAPAFFLTLGFLFFSATPAFPFDHSAWDALLKAHVEKGRVDYRSFLKDKSRLDLYLDTIERLPLREVADFSREERIALWINAFNASAIRLILEFYPVESTQKIPDFWDLKTVRIAGMRYSLKEVREKVFRRGFRDERATLALVSGTKSSSPLREEAYQGKALAEQLRGQMNVFLSDRRFNDIRPKRKKLLLSPLFGELADDFVLGYGTSEADEHFSPKELAVLGFIRIHVADPAVKKWITERHYKLRYSPADLRLNEISEKEGKGA